MCLFASSSRNEILQTTDTHTHISASSFPSAHSPSHSRLSERRDWGTRDRRLIRSLFPVWLRGLILDLASINLVQRNGCTACVINPVQSTEQLLAANTGAWNIVLDKEDTIQPGAAIHHNKSLCMYTIIKWPRLIGVVPAEMLFSLWGTFGSERTGSAFF